MNERIKSIDGWRWMAAFGVLYTHSWQSLNFPALHFAGLDLMQVINLIGNGVHLFFVISGFCFYLVLAKQKKYDLPSSLEFLKKRWLRIAPAFYVACIGYGLAYLSYFGATLPWRLLFNFLFLQTYVPGAEITPIFWSLGVEWHFYMLLPLIFIAFNRLGFTRTIVLVIILHTVLNLLHYKGLLMQVPYWQYTIFANIGHFAWGLLLGNLFSRGKRWALLTHPASILIGLAIAYTGRTFTFSQFVAKVGGMAYIFQSIGPIIMTLGFACMLYSCLENKTLSNIMGNKYFSSLGRVSYSFYLWHYLVLQTVYGRMQHVIPPTVPGLVLLMGCTLVILIPLSYLSYYIFESFYFRRQARLAKMAKLAKAV